MTDLPGTDDDLSGDRPTGPAAGDRPATSAGPTDPDPGGDRPATSDSPTDPASDRFGVGDGPVGDPVEEKVGKGVAHLQAAARELIAAARSALDAAEELVEDPRMADTVTGLLRSVVPARRPVPEDETGTAEGGGSPVQRIDVT